MKEICEGHEQVELTVEDGALAMMKWVELDWCVMMVACIPKIVGLRRCADAPPAPLHPPRAAAAAAAAAAATAAAAAAAAAARPWGGGPHAVCAVKRYMDRALRLL